MNNYSPHFLPGRGKKSNNQSIKVIHAVKSAHGDNFNKSLCGKSPGKKSLGWYETRINVNCEICKRKLSI